MSRLTENRAKEYLFSKFKSNEYRFFDKSPHEKNFDLWMEDITNKEKQKIELKSTEGEYKKPSDIFQKLYFSSEKEVEYFEAGITKILRVFLGDNPPTIFILDNGILSNGAEFREEYRAKIVGQKNYEHITKIESY